MSLSIYLPISPGCGTHCSVLYEGYGYAGARAGLEVLIGLCMGDEGAIHTQGLAREGVTMKNDGRKRDWGGWAERTGRREDCGGRGIVVNRTQRNSKHVGCTGVEEITQRTEGRNE